MIVRRKPRHDPRGSLERLFCDLELGPLIGSKPIVQANLSRTLKAGVVRGIHFQFPPHAEIKIVNCTRGSVFDVAVDLRKGSKTFMQWHGEVLAAGLHATSILPEGFGHAFQALEDDCELVYFHTARHQPDHAGSLSPFDPSLGIAWPNPVTELLGVPRAAYISAAEFKGIDL